MTERFPPLPRSDRAARLRSQLLAWFAQARRDLPWRRTQDPYAIWISEAMLQQTRVATVIDYWVRFLDAFPDVRTLAQSREEDVVALWSGLGYYSRARALRQAAIVILEQHGGEFPRSRQEALELPGVGEYTAGAVLSIAYGQPEALVDGNVERVLARLFALPGERGSAPLRKHLWKLTERLMPDQEAGDWNQALMELGAIVCTPKSPRCEECPWKSGCAARRSGDPLAFPAAKAKRQVLEVDAAALWIVREGRVLLHQRPKAGAMRDMWELPTQATAAGRGLWASAWPDNLKPKGAGDLWSGRHSITHHRIQVSVSAGELLGTLPSACAWFDLGEWGQIPMTGITKKVMAHLVETSPGSGDVAKSTKGAKLRKAGGTVRS